MADELLAELMMQAPYQPATNCWRAPEIRAVVDHGLPGGNGLDLGCGDGHLMEIILRRIGNRDLVGLDVDPLETEIARACKIYREVLTAPGHQMPFMDSSFDFVFSNSVLEHIENIDGVLREVARVLRPAGRFVFTVPGPAFHDCLRRPDSADREAYFRLVDARCAHLRYWTVAQWTEALARAGLRLTHSQEYLTEAQVQRWDTVARYTSGALMRLTQRKKTPIEIQRSLGLRSPRIRLPKSVARAIAALLQLQIGSPGSRFGCLLIEAERV